MTNSEAYRKISVIGIILFNQKLPVQLYVLSKHQFYSLTLSHTNYIDKYISIHNCPSKMLLEYRQNNDMNYKLSIHINHRDLQFRTFKLRFLKF